MSLPLEIEERIKDFVFLKDIRVGADGSHKRPFFSTNETRTSPSYDAYEHDVCLPPELKFMYSAYDSNHEFYIQDWTCLSVRDICVFIKELKTHGQEFVIPFSRRYIGMGHVIMAAYHPRDKYIFTFRYGGSNGYDRKENFEKLCCMTSTKMASNKTSIKKMYS